MKCPHCGEGFRPEESFVSVGQDIDGSWEVGAIACPECERLIITLHGNRWVGVHIGLPLDPSMTIGDKTVVSYLVRPLGGTARVCPKEVPAEIRKDFGQSASLLGFSANASAALGRRALQAAIRTGAKIKKATLYAEIEAVIATPGFPSHLEEALHTVREFGNEAAHPMKSQHTGEIFDVQVGEAEWILDTLELLFDFYFVQPQRARRMKDLANQRLKDAGKNPLP